MTPLLALALPTIPLAALPPSERAALIAALAERCGSPEQAERDFEAVAADGYWVWRAK